MRNILSPRIVVRVCEYTTYTPIYTSKAKFHRTTTAKSHKNEFVVSFYHYYGSHSGLCWEPNEFSENFHQYPILRFFSSSSSFGFFAIVTIHDVCVCDVCRQCAMNKIQTDNGPEQFFHRFFSSSTFFMFDTSITVWFNRIEILLCSYEPTAHIHTQTRTLCHFAWNCKTS